MTAVSVPRHVPAGTAADGTDPVAIGPAEVGWTYCGLRVLSLRPEEMRSCSTGDTEVILLPLSATDLTVVAGGETFHVDGRTSPFARVTDFVYVGRETDVVVTSASGGEVAVPSARCARRLPPKYGAAADVAVEVRGAGGATRQVTNFASPQAWTHADKLMCVELLTPDGNWSSYPPHKHDDSAECPVANEELYYFRIGRAGTTAPDPAGFGIHRTYTDDRAVDETIAVRDGDVYVIPRGYHGPCIAAPGYTMYYLNVLAGPGDERSMAFCDDPAHHWVRDSWLGMPADPRCPLVDAKGVVGTPCSGT